MANIASGGSFQTQIAMGGAGGGGEKDPNHYPGLTSIMFKGAEKAANFLGEKEVGIKGPNGAVCDILLGAIGSNSKNLMRVIFSSLFPSGSMKEFFDNNPGPWNVAAHAMASDRTPRELIGGGQGQQQQPGQNNQAMPQEMPGQNPNNFNNFNNFSNFNNNSGSSGSGGSGGGGGGGGDGGGGGGGGSNHAFTGAHAAAFGMAGVSGMQNVNRSMLGGFHPNPTPGIGGQGMSVGMMGM